MKILLFGEYSGFFNCLKDGLISLGHDVFLASNGDGFKNYPSDFRWDSHFAPKLGKLGPLYNMANILYHKNLFTGFDVVLLINPTDLARYKWVNKPVYDYIVKHNNKVFLSGSGDTSVMFNYWYNSQTKYRSYYEGYLLDDKNCRFLAHGRLEWEQELMDKIDGYIPIWYEYLVPYDNNPKCTNVVRIPVNISSFDYKPNILMDGKVVFYHGLTRECKGGKRYIKPAMDKIRKDYSDKAEFICAQKLPFKEYMSVIEKTNVIIDDANSYSIAMNGLFSLAKGKIVMGGAEPVANAIYGYDDNPVFNINPDIDQICDTMINIIKRKDEIEEIGKRGRMMVEKYHHHIDIAKQYESIFLRALNNSPIHTSK